MFLNKQCYKRASGWVIFPKQFRVPVQLPSGSNHFSGISVTEVGTAHLAGAGMHGISLHTFTE
jgi:hypothetical protein